MGKDSSFLKAPLLTLCRQLIKQAIELIYPPLCWSCQQRTGDIRRLLCPSCCEHMHLIESHSRCPGCFGIKGAPGKCRECRRGHLPFKRYAATFEPVGPPVALLSYLRRGYSDLGTTIAAFMVMQHTALDWPIPDAIIPFPTHILSGLHAPGKLVHRVAWEVARIFEKPLYTPLKKEIDFSFLREKKVHEPTRLVLGGFKKKELADKRLLLVSLSTPRDDLRKASLLLQEVFPQEINALSFLHLSR